MINPVSVYYDKLCSEHTFTHFEQYDSDYDEHPECPERTTTILEHIEKTDMFKNSKITLIKDQSYYPNKDDLEKVHCKQYLDNLDAYKLCDDKTLFEKATTLDSVYLHRNTWLSSQIAAGTCLKAVEDLFQVEQHLESRENSVDYENLDKNNNELKNIGRTDVPRASFCVTRPPGHHAFFNRASGFCFLNNAVIAARKAIDKFQHRRVVIFDWDVHHGNGTQQLTYNNNHILFISIHRNEDESFYPANEMQASDKLGDPDSKAKGLNINIPFSRYKNQSGFKCKDEEFLYATETVLPIIQKFNPSFVIISAGFDAARCDPIGGYEVSPETGYPGMLKRILSVCEPSVKTLLILEGGYNLNMIGKCTVSCLKFLVEYYSGRKLCKSVGDQVENNVETEVENAEIAEKVEKERESEDFDYSYKNISVQSLQEFALHNLAEVLTNLIPIWDFILNGCLSERLETIRTEIAEREEKRNAPVIELRRSPRKNSKKRRKSGENEDKNVEHIEEYNEGHNEQVDKLYKKQNSSESSKTDDIDDFQSPDVVHNLSKSFSQASINPEL